MKKIKEISAKDDALLHELEKLASKIWHEHYEPIIGIKQVAYMLKKFQSLKAMKEQLSEGYRYFVVFNENLVMKGYLSIQVREDALFLSKIYVDSAERGAGLGTLLLNKAKSCAKEFGVKHIELTVNKYNGNTIAWYKKQGFEIVKEAVFDIGEGYIMDDYVLQLPM